MTRCIHAGDAVAVKKASAPSLGKGGLQVWVPRATRLSLASDVPVLCKVRH